MRVVLWRRLAVMAALLALWGCPEVPAPHPSPRPPRSAAAGVAGESLVTPSSAPAQPSVAAPSAVPAQPVHPIGQRVDLVVGAMGTRVVLSGYTTATLDAAAVKRALLQAHQEIKRVESLMTSWRDDSEVSHINAAAGQAAVPIGAETFAVIAKSLWISKLSQGTFDITFASMGKLWRFDQDLVAKVPAAAALQRARRRIDYRKVKLDSANSSVTLTSPETRISLGGIAKGYAIDRAAKLLDQAGLTAFYAQAGGDLFVRGRKPDGSPWRVGVRDPRGPQGSYFATIAVQDHAFSTAGDYERSFVLGGKRYHHIIDPRTGYPATRSRSVTIWAKDALTADAIDDAVFILGPEQGLKLVESLSDCGAVIVDADNRVWISQRLKPVLRVQHPPTAGL